MSMKITPTMIQPLPPPVVRPPPQVKVPNVDGFSANRVASLDATANRVGPTLDRAEAQVQALVSAGVGRVPIGVTPQLRPGGLEVDPQGCARQSLGRSFDGGQVVGMLWKGEISFYNRDTLRELPSNLVPPSFKDTFVATLGDRASGATFKTLGNVGLGPVGELGQERQTLSDGTQFVVNAGQTAALLGTRAEDPSQSIIAVYTPGGETSYFTRFDLGLPFVGASSRGMTSPLDPAQVPAGLRSLPPPSLPPLGTGEVSAETNAALLDAFAELPAILSSAQLRPGMSADRLFSTRRFASSDDVASNPDVDLNAVTPDRLREALEAFAALVLSPGDLATFLGPRSDGRFLANVNGDTKTYSLESGALVDSGSIDRQNDGFNAAVANAFRANPPPPSGGSVSQWSDYWRAQASSPADLEAARRKLDDALSNASKSGQRMTARLWDALPNSARDAYRPDRATAKTWQNGYVKLEKDGRDVGHHSLGGSGQGRINMLKAAGIELVADQRMGGFVQSDGTNVGNTNLAYVRESRLKVGDDVIEFGKSDREVRVNGRLTPIGAEGLTLSNGSTLRADGDAYVVSTPDFDVKVNYYFDVETGVPLRGDVIKNKTNVLADFDGEGPRNWFQNFEVTAKRPGAVPAEGLLGTVLSQGSLDAVDLAQSRSSSPWHSDLTRYLTGDLG